MRLLSKLTQGFALIVGLAIFSVSGDLYAAASGNSSGNGNSASNGNTNTNNSSSDTSSSGSNGGNNTASTEVTGQLVPPNSSVIQGSTPTIGWLISRPVGHTNNGHGNNVDGVDSSNPGQGGGGPNGAIDQSDGVDDEIRGVDPVTGAPIGSNEIRQTDLARNITMYIYSYDDEGEATAQMPILDAGSEFELWADIAGELTWLDNMVVTGTPPTASFTVVSKDTSYDGVQSVIVNNQTITQNIYRTRCDVEFDLIVQVGNLSTVSTDPLMARELKLFNEGRDMTFNDAPTVWDYEFVQEFPYGIANTTITGTAPYTWTGLSRLNGGMVDKIGVEDVVVETYGGDWTSTDGTQTANISPWTVGSASVIVWPIASGNFTETVGSPGTPGTPFSVGTVFNDAIIPDIFVNYVDLYPGSETYVQIYKGVSNPGQVGLPILAVTEVPTKNLTAAELEAILNDGAQNTVPEGIKIRSVDLQQHINYLGNGTYTLEIISGNMPWLNLYMANKNGTVLEPYYELLGSCTFEVDQSSTVRGQLNTK